MITEVTKAHVDSSLSKTTSTWCSSAVMQSLLTTYQHGMCPNTGCPSVLLLWLIWRNVYITSREWPEEVLCSLQFFFQPEIVVNALVPFRKRFHSAGSLCPINSGFWSPPEVISLNDTPTIKVWFYHPCASLSPLLNHLFSAQQYLVAETCYLLKEPLVCWMSMLPWMMLLPGWLTSHVSYCFSKPKDIFFC